MNKQLLLLRQSTGASVSEMAKLLNLTENEYLDYEINDKKIDDTFISKISELYDVSKEWLSNKN